MPITANTAKAERALHDSEKPDKDNHKQGLGGARYSGPPSALQKRAVSYRTTLAFPPHTRQPLFLQDASTFPGQINVLCMTAGKNAIKGCGTDEPVKVSENKQGNAKEYLALEQLPSLSSYKPILTFLPPASINLLIFSCAHRCTRYPIPLLKLSIPYICATDWSANYRKIS